MKMRTNKTIIMIMYTSVHVETKVYQQNKTMTKSLSNINSYINLILQKLSLPLLAVHASSSKMG